MKDNGLRDYEKLVTALLSPTTGLYRNQLMDARFSCHTAFIDSNSTGQSILAVVAEF